MDLEMGIGRCNILSGEGERNAHVVVVVVVVNKNERIVTNERIDFIVTVAADAGVYASTCVYL
jgi:hypothetical protein